MLLSDTQTSDKSILNASEQHYTHHVTSKFSNCRPMPWFCVLRKSSHWLDNWSDDVDVHVVV